MATDYFNTVCELLVSTDPHAVKQAERLVYENSQLRSSISTHRLFPALLCETARRGSIELMTRLCSVAPTRIDERGPSNGWEESGPVSTFCAASYGKNALHCAAKASEFSSVVKLVELGAETTVGTARGGNTVLHILAKRRAVSLEKSQSYVAALRVCATPGALTSVNLKGHTALDIATFNSNAIAAEIITLKRTGEEGSWTSTTSALSSAARAKLTQLSKGSESLIASVKGLSSENLIASVKGFIKTDPSPSPPLYPTSPPVVVGSPPREDNSKKWAFFAREEEKKTEEDSFLVQLDELFASFPKKQACSY